MGNPVPWNITRCHVLVHLCQSSVCVESLECLGHVLRSQPPLPSSSRCAAPLQWMAATWRCRRQHGRRGLDGRRAKDKKVPGGPAGFKISPTVKIIGLATLFRLASGVIKHVWNSLVPWNCQAVNLHLVRWFSIAAIYLVLNTHRHGRVNLHVILGGGDAAGIAGFSSSSHHGLGFMNILQEQIGTVLNS
jgi:hypothetical protein